MSDQITGEPLKACIRPHHLLTQSHCPVCILLSKCIRLCHQRIKIITFAHTDLPCFIDNRHGRPVRHRIVNVINRHITPKHRLRVLIVHANGRTCKANKAGIGQGITQVLGIACAVFAITQLFAKAVLATVGFIGDDDDVFAHV